MSNDAIQRLKNSVDSWTQTLPGSEETQPKTAAQMDETVSALNEINASHPELSFDPLVTVVKERLTYSSRKKFVGSWLMVVVVAIVWLFLMKGNIGRISAKITPEQALVRATQSIDYTTKKIGDLENKPQLTSAEKNNLKEARDELPKWQARANDPASYSRQVNLQTVISSICGIISCLIMLGFVALYFWTSRLPQYVIDKRKKETAIADKSRGAVMKVLIGAIMLPLSVEWFETVRYRWSDGHKTEETNFNPVVVAMIIIAIIVVLLIVMAMIYLLPILALFNLVRNRNYVFGNRARARLGFLDKIPLVNKLS
jgi:hypothetical protein